MTLHHPAAESSPTDAHLPVPVALRMSTHLAVVVAIRMERHDGSEAAGLVIPRSQCQGDRPRRGALLSAAACLRMRAPGGQRRHLPPQRVLVCVDDRWLPLDALPAEALAA
jgi:hypothetical protein